MSSNAGKPGPSGDPVRGQKCQSGCAWSSSQRSFVTIERVEERDRVGDMDDHRTAQLGSRLPQGVETHVVHSHQPARPDRGP